MSALLEWPVELVQLVLVNLHALQIAKCREVCRYLLELIDASMELRLRIELAQDGHVLRFRGNEPAISLRERVISHRRALDGTTARLVFKTETPGFMPIRYDISDGVICRLVVAQGTCRLVYNEIGCLDSHKRWEKCWDYPEMKVSDVSFLAARDIQILTEDTDYRSNKRLHFRTISNNSPHPQAADAYYDLNESSYWETSFTLIHEDILAMVFKDDEPYVGRVIALNWTTCEVILPLRHASDASFIAKDLLLLVVADEVEDETDEVAFEIVSLTSGETLYQCRLPFSQRLQGISLINNQNFHFPRNQFVVEPKVLMPDTDLNIQGVSVNMEAEEGPITVVIIISIKKLLDACTRLASQHAGNRIEWENWGPTTTRWLPSSWVDGGDLCVFGSRIAIWDRSENAEGGLLILDFNPRNLGRVGIAQEAHSHSTVSSYDLMDGELRVMSSLPFRKLTIGEVPYQNVDLDGTTLVCREGWTDLHVLSMLAGDTDYVSGPLEPS